MSFSSSRSLSFQHKQPCLVLTRFSLPRTGSAEHQPLEIDTLIRCSPALTYCFAYAILNSTQPDGQSIELPTDVLKSVSTMFRLREKIEMTRTREVLIVRFLV